MPPLPPAKTASIKKLGYGNLEKVIVQFPYNFWRNKMNDKNLFIGRLQHVNQIYLNKNNKNKEKKVYKNISDQNGLNYHTMNDDDKGEERGMFFWFVDMSKIANCPTLVAIIPAKVKYRSFKIYIDIDIHCIWFDILLSVFFVVLLQLYVYILMLNIVRIIYVEYYYQNFKKYICQSTIIYIYRLQKY